jgi:dTDP-4-amino-4,6-dideoxygalactose transaminase
MTQMSASYRIPFNRPTRTALDQSLIAEALASGKLAGDGGFTHRCQATLEKMLGVPRALLTTSCTDALEMAALLANISDGDEVIVPTYTFVSSINAFVLRGARPVFADIRQDTLGLDERQLPALITPRTRAIVVVHYAGVPCDMDAVMDAARRVGAVVIEDNAHGFLGGYQGRLLGTIGDLATLSFHDTKNFTCGEGGALLVNDPALIERAEVIREKGTDRKKFLRGQVDKYGWVDVGSSFLPSEILAAMLAAQLDDADGIQSSRGRIWQRYARALAGWASANGVVLPRQNASDQPSYHMFNMLVPDIAFRDGLFAHLRERGIQAVSHYIPLHLSPMGRQFGGSEGQCPVAERVNELIVRLPFFTNLTGVEQDEVIEAVTVYTGARLVKTT